MKTIRLKPICGSLLLIWAGLGIAQANGIDQAAVLSQQYQQIQQDSPGLLTDEEQQQFEHKIKALQFKQEMQRKNLLTSGAKSATKAQSSEEQGEGAEFYNGE